MQLLLENQSSLCQVTDLVNNRSSSWKLGDIQRWRKRSVEKKEEKGGGERTSPGKWKVSAVSQWMGMEIKKGERRVFCNRGY